VRRHGFSLIEMLVVFSIIAVVAGLVVGLATRGSTAGKRSRIQAELEQLQTLIEDYHAKLGFYPPSNTNNPALNPLFYELTGTIYNPASQEYRTLAGDEVVRQSDVKRVFGIDGFLNSGPDKGEVRVIHRSIKSTEYKEITTSPDIEVLTVAYDGPNDVVNPATGKRVNAWRYVSVNPTNNPTSFDLWAEVVIGGKVEVFKNWKD
jgi:prepilin-type N-terminal cleavage/methylation domain-containing protein